jgi:hypothetical protein
MTSRIHGNVGCFGGSTLPLRVGYYCEESWKTGDFDNRLLHLQRPFYWILLYNVSVHDPHHKILKAILQTLKWQFAKLENFYFRDPWMSLPFEALEAVIPISTKLCVLFA